MSTTEFWATRGDTARRLVTSLSAIASLVGLAIPFLPPRTQWAWWVYALMFVATLTTIFFVAFEYISERRRHVYPRSDTVGIREYMHRWIEHGGRVAIWTRDISWADNGATKDLLTQKAKRKELILCMPELNGLAEELSAAGAEVCTYGADVLELPAARFTIRDYGRDGSSVAVGRTRGDTHVIEEFDSGSHPVFFIAQDLVEVARSVGAKK